MKNIVMTQENKELLLKDLCARLQYGVKISVNDKIESLQGINVLDNVVEYHSFLSSDIEEVKPYLFPLSSMTEEQYEKFIIISGWDGDIEDIRRGKFSCIGYIGLDYIYDTIDWFNKNHFDYRGLIEKGLAIEAPEGMYN